MDPVLNPFKPGAGQRPPILAGRDALLHDFDIVRRRITELGEGDRSWILTGLRGVGKTVLIGELERVAVNAEWLVAKVEVRKGHGLADELATRLAASLRRAQRRFDPEKLESLLRVFKSFTASLKLGVINLGVEITPAAGYADTGRLSTDLTDLFVALGEAARGLGVGGLILVDELQDATAEEMAAISTAIHQISQTSPMLPLFFVGAGLPSLPSQLATANSYAERLYQYRTLSVLDAANSRAALMQPVIERDAVWDEDALEVAMAAANGYPYFLQEVGKAVWNFADGPRFTVEDAKVGTEIAREEVNAGLYQSRWDRATPAQRELLRALANKGHGEGVMVRELARAMKKPNASVLSVPRDELIKKGLVYAPERGVLAFTVPGFHQFILNQH
ncbi:ATP-binding protein [Skermania sp. ID1734]|uniref:ATP-binding protein n=1 Tax=Skermania sp. ID1734 TaxID=2597516 RepID=UPI00117DECF4|nr:ATP-binding protein [Skermania sp. ID1734]TSD93272.1 ATP-binding protein [Skermania sp. ID1734]